MPNYGISLSDMQELFKKLRKYEVKIRKAVNAHQQGEFKSIFKGTGLEFDDVRQYQYGDDVRAIDWNVTAKGHGAFIKTFKEERDQSVFFVVDVSASQEIGKQNAQKIDLAKELTGVLGLAAANIGSQVGLLCFTDQREKFIKPGKGNTHIYNLITELYKLTPTSRGTNIRSGIVETLARVKRKSVIILISDFLDTNYDNELKSLAKRHDLIVLHVYDPTESKLPNLGITPVIDKETGRKSWVNTSFFGFGKKSAKQLAEKTNTMEALCKKFQIDYLKLETGTDYTTALIGLFNKRNKSWKRG